MDPQLLVILARIQLRAGELPMERNALVYGAESRGSTCRLCRKPIKRGAQEVELMWLWARPGRRSARLHTECHEAWVEASRFPLTNPLNA